MAVPVTAMNAQVPPTSRRNAATTASGATPPLAKKPVPTTPRTPTPRKEAARTPRALPWSRPTSWSLAMRPAAPYRSVDPTLLTRYIANISPPANPARVRYSGRGAQKMAKPVKKTNAPPK